jgi:hypothetical protein
MFIVVDATKITRYPLVVFPMTKLVPTFFQQGIEAKSKIVLV